MTEKLLPEKIVAYQEKPGAYGKWIHAYAAHDLEGFLHATYVRADIATPAPVSGEVEEAIDLIDKLLNQIGGEYPIKATRKELVFIRGVITAAKTAAPEFTREELVDFVYKKILARYEDETEIDRSYAHVDATLAVRVLIDMGALKVLA